MYRDCCTYADGSDETSEMRPSLSENKNEEQESTMEPVFHPVENKMATTDLGQTVHELVEYFKTTYAAEKGDRYNGKGFQDHMIIQRLLARKYTPDDIKRRMREFLQDPLEWQQRPAWTITSLETQWDRYGASTREDLTCAAHQPVNWDEIERER